MMEIILPVDYDEITWKDRQLVRREYIIMQEGFCYHCKSLLSNDPSEEVMNLVINEKLFPKKFFNYPIRLHHSHVTGMTIGAVHARCNAVLWQYHGE